jgi:Cytochrome C oxidase, cbb3-type, subunit III
MAMVRGRREDEWACRHGARRALARTGTRAVPSWSRRGRVGSRMWWVRTVLALCLGAGVLGGCTRDPSPGGKVLYARFCASCHGVDGTGDGPVAASLTRRPSDLTTWARRHGGRFDDAEVMGVIDGRRVVAEHGTREMPVWGLMFEQELAGQLHGRYVGLLRSRALADYLRTMQQP